MARWAKSVRMARHLPHVSTNLLSAASYLCCAVDDLRAAGLATLADEVDSFIAVLDAKIEGLNGTTKTLRPPGPRVNGSRKKTLGVRS
jgi:hypothetical protein